VSELTKIEATLIGGTASGDNLTRSGIYLQIHKGKRVANIMIDFGIWQGVFTESREQNFKFPKRFNAGGIDCIVLTHAHLDHVGGTPLAWLLGFRGKIFCTQPTAKLLPIMLKDSVKVQASQTKYLRRKERNKNKQNGNKKKGRVSYNGKTLSPLYTLFHVEQSLRLVKNGGYMYDETRKWIKIANGVELKFYPSGHVLGGAICVLRVRCDCQPSGYYHLGFSGDLGRKDGFILPPPFIPEERIDCWFSESTYGGVEHPDRDDEIETLINLLNRVAGRNGKIIIPSFALERTQEMIYVINLLMDSGRITKMPIYLDSPMALEITKVFAGYWNSGLFSDQRKLHYNAFDVTKNRHLKVIESEMESAALSKSDGPYVVTAGAGMCDYGRVRNHLRAGLSDAKNAVALVGYMAGRSLGRKLEAGDQIVKIDNQLINVNAEVVKFSGFSAHADGPFLVETALQVLNLENPEWKIIEGHGEELRGLMLKHDLIEALGLQNNAETDEKIIIPNAFETFTIYDNKKTN
jgi:metallo-beta-lactamase family protein